MAKGFKSGGRNFQKGNKCSKGGVRLPEIIKKYRVKNKEDIFVKLQHWWIELDANGLKKEILRIEEKGSAEDRAFMKQILQATNGDEKSMKFICEWMYKPNPKPVHLSGSIETKTDAKLCITKTEYKAK
jgi:hypothetical protein